VSERHCIECRYWDPRVAYAGQGECRRFPPHPAVKPQGGVDRISPITGAYFNCGEFKDRYQLVWP